jgi:hypothetical protein
VREGGGGKRQKEREREREIEIRERESERRGKEGRASEGVIHIDIFIYQ